MANGPSAVDMLTPPFQRAIREVRGETTGGYPAMLPLMQLRDGALIASWTDGSMAAALWREGRIAGWRAITSPRYADLFADTVSRETMPEGRDD